jgi:hypothetical protein
VSRQIADPAEGSLALPFEAPRGFKHPPGATLQEIVDALVDSGQLDAAWLPRLKVYIDDASFDRSIWSKVRPREGRIVALRAQPGIIPGLTAFLVDMAINVAISAGISMLTQAFVGGGPQMPGFEQIADIEASRNEIARWRKVPAVLGQFRCFPPHAAKHYTQGIDEKVVLRMLLCWGLGPIALANLKIGDTPIEKFSGVKLQHKLTPDDPWPTIFSSSPDEDPGPGRIVFDDGWVERTTTSDQCDLLQLEFGFPDGLIFYSGDGSLKTFGVDFRIRYRETGTSQWLDFVTGAPATEGHLYELDGYKKQKPFRMNFEKAVARGRYDVAYKRVSPDDPGPKGMNAMQWLMLRSFTFAAPVTNNHLAATAIEIEASDQLDGMIDLINGEAHRIAPRWDDVEEEFGAAGPTSNPAELTRWIACGPGAPNPRDPETEINTEKFGAWAALCHERGWRCDMELRAGAGQDEIMRQVAQCGRATLVTREGKLEPVIDDVKPATRQVFTAKNAWGFRSQRRYAAESHAVRCTFNNAEKDYQPDEMLVFYPGYDANNADPGRFVALKTGGKVYPNEVREAALRYIAEDLIRVEDYVWSCDWESLVCGKGDRVGLAHFAIAVGRQPARIHAVTLDEAEENVVALTLDEAVTQTEGDTYGIAWRQVADEEITRTILPLTNMENGRGKVVTLATPRAVAIAPKPGDLVVFGDAGIETLDATISQIPRRTSELEGEIHAVPYDPGLFNGDIEGLTEFDDDTSYDDDTLNIQDLGGFQSAVSGEAFPPPPKPQIINTLANASGIFVDYTFPAKDAWRVNKVELYQRRDDDEGLFELVRPLPGDARLAAFPAGQLGLGYLLKLVAIDARGRRTESDIIEIVSQAAQLPFSGYLTKAAAVVSTAADGTGGDYSTAGGVFRIQVGDAVIDPIVDDEGAAAANFAVISATPGLSVSIDAEGVYTIGGLTLDSGQAVLRAVRNGVALDRTYAISKNKASAPVEPETPPSGFSATITLTSTTGGVNLRSLADAAGYTGFSDAHITFVVPNGVSIVGAAGAPNGGNAIDTGVWPTELYDIDLTLEIASGGKVLGGGGAGGVGVPYNHGAPGGRGGDAVYLRAPLAIENNGILKGGGGGGGGGGGARGRPPIGSGDLNAGGGGGGGGQPNGPGGAGADVNGTDGNAGAAASELSPGAGGARVSNTVYSQAGKGGDGGVFGAPGNAGENAILGSKNKWNGGAGGTPGGAAVRANDNDAPLTGGGEIVGEVV